MVVTFLPPDASLAILSYHRYRDGFREYSNRMVSMRIERMTHAGLDGFPEVLRVDYRSPKDGYADWTLVRPSERAELWVVCLHGHGSHGDQLYTRPDIRDWWLSRFLQHRVGILTPNLRDNAWMGPAAAADLHELLAWTRNQYRVKRFLFFSGSMGGTGNLIYAVLHPDDVAAAVALGAASDPASYRRWCRTQQGGVVHEIADAIEESYGDHADLYHRHSPLKHASKLTMPVYLAHGADDAIIPVDQSQRLANAMAGRPNFIYREIPSGDHDSPLADGDAFDWAIARLEA